MTHSVEHSGDILTKHYTSWSRGEPTREWAALSLLSRETTDLVPTPLATSTDAHPWVSLWAGFWLTLIGPGGPSAHRNPPGTAEAQAGRVLRLVAGAS